MARNGTHPPLEFTRLVRHGGLDLGSTEPGEKPQYRSIVEALNNQYSLYHINRAPGVPGITTEYIPQIGFHIISKTRPKITGQGKGRASEKTVANCSFTLGIEIMSGWPEIDALADLVEEHGALGDLGTTQDKFTGEFLRDFRWQELGRSKKYNFETGEATKKAMTKIIMDTGASQGFVSAIAMCAQWQREPFISENRRQVLNGVVCSFRDYIRWKVDGGEGMMRNLKGETLSTRGE